MKKCELCGKGSKMVGHRKLLRGHYNPTNWTRKYPNLQKATTPKGENVLACTNCIRTFSKEARMAANRAKKAKLAEQRAKEAQARAEKRKAAEAKKAKAKKEKPNKAEEKKEKPKKKEAKK